MFLNENEEQKLRDKWAPVLDHENAPPLPKGTKRDITTRLLENQHQSILEAGQLGGINSPVGNQGSGQISGWDPILINLVRRSTPNLLAYDTIGVQPMTGPTGMVFYMKSYYEDADTTEFQKPGVKPKSDFSGTTGTSEAQMMGTVDSAFGAGAFGDDGNTRTKYNEMRFGIEKASVEARTRALKARYTTELAQDLKVVHGLDAESELGAILSAEIIAETNWEVIDKMNTLAIPSIIPQYTLSDTADDRTVFPENKFDGANGIGDAAGYVRVLGADGTYMNNGDSTPGYYAFKNEFNLNENMHNGGGRWSGEKYKSLIMQINREANIITRQTGRGRGNFLIVSADVAAALDMTSSMAVPSIDGNLGGNDQTASLFAGVLGGKYKVYIDPYAISNDILIGYKGASEMDAGMFYCPYVPLQMMKSQGEEDFQPRIGFKTRYGLVSNPFAANVTTSHDLGLTSTMTTLKGTNPYYRKFTVKSL